MAKYDEPLVQQVWEQARADQDRDPNEWRRDQCGAWMNRGHYDSSKSEYGWRILNVFPGGDDAPENLQAFHRHNDFDLANGRPRCAVTADRTDIAPGQHVDQPRNTSIRDNSWVIAQHTGTSTPTSQAGNTMGKKTLDEISNRIGAALEGDTRVNLHRSPVTVSIENHRVRLEGLMQHIAEKRAAVDTAARTLLKYRQWSIDDRLYIKPAEHKEDLELSEEVAAALSNESAFRDYTLSTETTGAVKTIHDAGTTDRVIRAGVHDSAVTLSGRVQSVSHSRLAEVLVWWTGGCCFVDNVLEVVPPQEDTDDEINDAVRIVMEKDPLVRADQLQLGTAGGVVVISGSVASSEEKRFAVLDAWYVPGVSDVVDHIETRD